MKSPMKPGSQWRRIAWLASLLTVLALIGLLFVRWRKRKPLERTSRRRLPVEIEGPPPGISGLSEREAAARRPDFDLEAEMRAEQRLFRNRAIRQSLFTIFNIDLFGIALILFLLGSPAGALGTLLLLALNLVVTVFQEMYTKKKLDLIMKELRPQATVIREGRLRSIDPVYIVQGDCLVVTTGDEFLVNGELIGDEGIRVEEAESPVRDRQVAKAKGDQVVAGSYCLQGRGVYRALEDGHSRYRSAPGSDLQLLLGKRTPLQQFMEMVFRALFALVLVFGLLLVADALIHGAKLVSPEYRDAFSIVFGIAPTSLFFILIVTYVMGTLRISEHGALVYKTQSIETLANVTTLCVSKESLVAGFKVELEPIEPPVGYEGLSENLIRRILGVMVHSASGHSKMEQMLAQALPGEARAPKQSAPFIFKHGWYGAAFDEADLRGTYMLGLPEVLDDHLVKPKEDILKNVEEGLSQARRGLGRWLRGLRGREERAADVLEDVSDHRSAEEQGETAPEVTERPDQPTPWRGRMLDRLQRLLTPMEDLDLLDEQPQEPQEGIQLRFAYLDAPAGLYDSSGRPRIPDGLIPLVDLHIAEAVREEAGTTIQALVENGLKVKILSAGPPEQAAVTAQLLGLLDSESPMVDGAALANIGELDLAQAVQGHTIFGDLSPNQKAAVVRSLRAQGDRVMVVGSRVGDVPAMRQADLRVALKSSDQAALRLTDIVLLEDSLEALPYVLSTGQRMVNGVLDTFKLYLSHVIAQLLLILSMVFLRLESFPYHPTQAGVISAFTIAIPNAFLSAWAAAGRVTGGIIRRGLARFIIPAALTGALLAWLVYILFLSRTQDVKYAQLAVTFALLMAGWLRVLFVQPPTSFWVGGAPLRGDRRVIGLVIASVLIFAAILAVPLFRDLLRINFLDSVADYGLVSLAVAIWMLLLRAIWRSKILEPLIDRIAPEGNQ
jgi:cation-transporting ATPase E